MSKFSGIKFPLYGLFYKPEVAYSQTKIAARNKDKTYLVDDTSLTGNYLVRLSQIKNRINFDATILSLQELLVSRVVWGVDSTGKIFDFSTKEKYPYYVGKIRKIKDNLVWVSTITYPFKIKHDLVGILNDNIYIHLIKIDMTWYLYKFSYKYDRKRVITL